jgi:hypothetical protein
MCETQSCNSTSREKINIKIQIHAIDEVNKSIITIEAWIQGPCRSCNDFKENISIVIIGKTLHEVSASVYAISYFLYVLKIERKDHWNRKTDHRCLGENTKCMMPNIII